MRQVINSEFKTRDCVICVYVPVYVKVFSTADRRVPRKVRHMPCSMEHRWQKQTVSAIFWCRS